MSNFGEDPGQERETESRQAPQPEPHHKRRWRQCFLEIRSAVNRGQVTSRSLLADVAKLPVCRQFQLDTAEIARMWPDLFVSAECRECNHGTAFLMGGQAARFDEDKHGNPIPEKLLEHPKAMFRCENCGHEWSLHYPTGWPMGLAPDDKEPVDFGPTIQALRKGIKVWPVGHRMRASVRDTLRDVYGFGITDTEYNQPQAGVAARMLTEAASRETKEERLERIRAAVKDHSEGRRK